MDRNDAIKVINDLYQRPFICGDDYIITDSGYKIIKPQKDRLHEADRDVSIQWRPK